MALMALMVRHWLETQKKNVARVGTNGSTLARNTRKKFSSQVGTMVRHKKKIFPTSRHYGSTQNCFTGRHYGSTLTKGKISLHGSAQ